MILSSGFVITVLAKVSLLVGVSTFMASKGALLNCCVIAVLACVRFIVRMGTLMYDKVVLSASRIVAILAFDRLVWKLLFRFWLRFGVWF